MKRNKVSALLAALMTATVAAGCTSQEPDPTPTESAAPVESTEPTVESVEPTAEAATPADDEIVSRTYTLENAMDTTITELYVYRSKGEDLAGNDGLAPGEQVTAEVLGYYLHSPKETLHTVEFVADGSTYSFETLHVEDLFEILYLVGAEDTVDATSGATVVAFEKPEG